MARSDYIYVLQNLDGTIMAARTVKRELIGFIHHRCGWSRSLLEKYCQVLRLPDGGGQAFVCDWSEIPEKTQ